jgi:hypothetical protein
MGGDKNCGALTSVPSGFTAEYALTSTSVSLYFIWGVSAGETSYAVSWTTTSSSGNYLWAGEYSEAGSGAWQMLAKASNITNETSVQSTASGTTSAVARDGIGIAAFAVDSGGNIGATDTVTWSNSFTTRDVNPAVLGSGQGAGWVIVAEKAITSGSTASTTMTYTAGAVDQWSGAVAVFARTASAAMPIIVLPPRR